MSSKRQAESQSPKAYTRGPLYAWLIALYPIIFLYSLNIEDVFGWQVRNAALASLAGVTLIVCVVGLITQNIHKAGMVAAIFALAFFSYGHVYNLLLAEHPEWESALKLAYLLISLIAIILVLRLKRTERLERAAPYLNLMAGALVIMTLPPLTMYWVRGLQQSAAAAERDTGSVRLPNSDQRPDVYYILLDGYSSNAFLEHDFGYDNSAFTDALAERGFYVADDSHTSYAITVPSKFSTLNMRYISEADKEAAKDYQSDIEYLRQGIADSEAARELQSLGYTYIFMLSGYDVPSQIADVNVDFHPSGAVYFEAGATSEGGSYDASKFYQVPFYPLLLSTTALHSYAQRVEEEAQMVADQPYDFREPLRALEVWDEAETIPALPEATFTVIHIIKPHEPVAFDAEGNIVQPYANTQNSTREELSERFFQQLEFVNNRTLALIDTIIKESDVPPIIFLQGDHGSVFGNPRSADKRRTNFGILNAYRFPDRECAGLSEDIIPINGFRVMFNCYFEGNYDLLDSHYYELPVGYEDLFRFKEIDIAAWSAEHEGR